MLPCRVWSTGGQRVTRTWGSGKNDSEVPTRSTPLPHGQVPLLSFCAPHGMRKGQRLGLNRLCIVQSLGRTAFSGTCSQADMTAHTLASHKSPEPRLWGQGQSGKVPGAAGEVLWRNPGNRIVEREVRRPRWGRERPASQQMWELAPLTGPVPKVLPAPGNFPFNPKGSSPPVGMGIFHILL